MWVCVCARARETCAILRRLAALAAGHDFVLRVSPACSQCATCVAICIGTLTPACKSSDQCPVGMYCSTGFSNRCQFCGSHSPVLIQYGEGTTAFDEGETYNAAYDKRFAGYNRSFVADLCHNPVYVGTCHSQCKDPTVIVSPYKGGKWDTLTCGEQCADFDEDYGAGGKHGFNFPPNSGRIGYDANGGWQARRSHGPCDDIVSMHPPWTFHIWTASHKMMRCRSTNFPSAQQKSGAIPVFTLPREVSTRKTSTQRQHRASRPWVHLTGLRWFAHEQWNRTTRRSAACSRGLVSARPGAPPRRGSCIT